MTVVIQLRFSLQILIFKAIWTKKIIFSQKTQAAFEGHQKRQIIELLECITPNYQSFLLLDMFPLVTDSKQSVEITFKWIKKSLNLVLKNVNS